MEALDALVVDVDVIEIVEALQHEVARIIEDVGARMVVHPLEEHLEGDAVVQILAGMDLVGSIDALLIEMVEDRTPATRQLVEGLFHQPRRTLRPGIDIGPGQRAGEGRMAINAEAAAGSGGILDLLHGPFLPRLGVAAHMLCGEAVEHGVIGGMDRHQLALQVCRKLGDFETVRSGNAFHLVAIVLAFGRLVEVEQAPVPAGNLDTLVAKAGDPFADRVERIERRLVARELGKEDGGALDRLHVFIPLRLPDRPSPPRRRWHARRCR